MHLQGELIQNSPYRLNMNVNRTCQLLCDPITLTEAQADDLSLKVEQLYTQHWIVDNLPAAALSIDKVEYSQLGFPIGAIAPDGSTVIYNHARIVLSVHQDPSFEGFRVVGFEVEPVTVAQTWEKDPTSEEGELKLTNCPLETGYLASDAAPMYVAGPMSRKKVDLAFSYDTFFVQSDVRWASRWDIYLSMGSSSMDSVHWFNILTSSIIAVFLTSMVGLIMWRAIHRDISRYNRVATDEEKAEDREESGWKLVHTDVFRPPSTAPLAFAVMTGVGAQVSFMAIVTIIFSALGFLNPANRGSLVIAAIVIFCLLGFVAGYASARNHKLFDGKLWQRTTLLSAFAFPGFVGGVLLVMNSISWAGNSTNAVPFGSLVAVIALWLCISVPLTFLGAYYGFKAEKLPLPTRVGTYPRVIPAQPWFLSPAFTMLVGGILPFGTIFIELFFILTSIWLDRYYYVFGFLLLVALLLAITCAEIAIVFVYFQLCAEDYRWWWRSWLVPGASAIYVALYSAFYCATRLQIAGFAPMMLYIGYTLLASVSFFLVTGCIGYLATFTFVWRIYDAVKVD